MSPENRAAALFAERRALGAKEAIDPETSPAQLTTQVLENRGPRVVGIVAACGDPEPWDEFSVGVTLAGAMASQWRMDRTLVRRRAAGGGRSRYCWEKQSSHSPELTSLCYWREERKEFGEESLGCGQRFPDASYGGWTVEVQRCALITSCLRRTLAIVDRGVWRPLLVADAL